MIISTFVSLVLKAFLAKVGEPFSAKNSEVAVDKFAIFPLKNYFSHSEKIKLSISG